MIDYAKIMRGHVPLISDAFPVPELLADVVDMVASKAATQGVEILVLPRPTTPHKLVGDGARLMEILCAVMDNAVRHSHTGGTVWLRIADGDIMAGKYMMHFEIRDEGEGMDEATVRSAHSRPAFWHPPSAFFLTPLCKPPPPPPGKTLCVTLPVLAWETEAALRSRGTAV